MKARRETAEARRRRVRLARALRLPHTLNQLAARFDVDRLTLWADLRFLNIERLPGDDDSGGDPRYRVRS